MSQIWIRTLIVALIASQVVSEQVTILSQIHLIKTDETTSVPSDSILHSEQHRSTNLNSTLRLENVLEVFNLRDLATLWPNATGKFSSVCTTDMNEYFYGLQQRQIWATKSEYLYKFVFN